MSQELKPLLFEEEHLIRVVDRGDAEPWFVGVDVCRVLGIRDHHQALERLDDDERGRYNVPTPQGDQEVKIVSEPGVYRLTFTSRKPVAERLKRWLAHEVLPTIRKTGGYGQQAEGPTLPTTEKRPFPDWALEEMRTKKATVDMYRLLYGPMAAQWVSPQLGFPVPPIELIEHGRQYTINLSLADAA